MLNECKIKTDDTPDIVSEEKYPLNDENTSVSLDKISEFLGDLLEAEDVRRLYKS